MLMGEMFTSISFACLPIGLGEALSGRFASFLGLACFPFAMATLSHEREALGRERKPFNLSRRKFSIIS